MAGVNVFEIWVDPSMSIIIIIINLLFFPLVALQRQYDIKAFETSLPFSK